MVKSLTKQIQGEEKLLQNSDALKTLGSFSADQHLTHPQLYNRLVHLDPMLGQDWAPPTPMPTRAPGGSREPATSITSQNSSQMPDSQPSSPV